MAQGDKRDDAYISRLERLIGALLRLIDQLGILNENLGNEFDHTRKISYEVREGLERTREKLDRKLSNLLIALIVLETLQSIIFLAAWFISFTKLRP
jgi:molecular chaperone GrpE (heat shock protein)